MSDDESQESVQRSDASAKVRVLIVSDIHYACESEQARAGHEGRVISCAPVRWAAAAYRRFVWLAEPHQHNHRVQQILEREPNPDWVVINGDLTSDTAFIGVSDDAASQSVVECLELLRSSYGERMHLCIGDHEIGKKSLFGGAGGPRLKSLSRAIEVHGFQKSWRRDIGVYSLVGVASTLAAWPVFAGEALEEEAEAWGEIAAGYTMEIADLFGGIDRDRKILLFCHDPSALMFLANVPEVCVRMENIETTVLGHLHSPSLLRLAMKLAGFPETGLMGNSVRRYTRALNNAEIWSAFRPMQCPSPAGLQCLKDGGYLTVELDPSGMTPPVWVRHRLLW